MKSRFVGAPRSTSALVLALATPLLLVQVGACGQVTGLSSDYTYDLEGGSADGAPRDGSADASSDAADAADAAPKCTPAMAASTSMHLMDQFGGTSQCDTCLATACCTLVDTCIASQTCKNPLSCALDCTQKNVAAERTVCISRCPITNAAFVPLQQCAAQPCKAECGF